MQTICRYRQEKVCLQSPSPPAQSPPALTSSSSSYETSEESISQPSSPRQSKKKTFAELWASYEDRDYNINAVRAQRKKTEAELLREDAEYDAKLRIQIRKDNKAEKQRKRTQMSVQMKIRAPGAKTFLQVIQARFGSRTHLVFCAFAIMTNIIVTAMLMLGKNRKFQTVRLTGAHFLPQKGHF